jgi:hypothetical protein
MAQRRMFSAQIVNSDAFLDMPISSQALYFHLGMHSDDDGFVSPRKVLRLIGAGDDDLKVLLSKSFVIPFDSGVIVITHWKQNNYIQADRYTPTIYKAERRQLSCVQNVYELDTARVQIGSAPDTQIGRKGEEKETHPLKKNEDALSPARIDAHFAKVRAILRGSTKAKPRS